MNMGALLLAFGELKMNTVFLENKSSNGFSLRNAKNHTIKSVGFAEEELRTLDKSKDPAAFLDLVAYFFSELIELLLGEDAGLGIS